MSITYKLPHDDKIRTIDNVFTYGDVVNTYEGVTGIVIKIIFTLNGNLFYQLDIGDDKVIEENENRLTKCCF